MEWIEENVLTEFQKYQNMALLQKAILAVLSNLFCFAIELEHLTLSKRCYFAP
jgi:hypothetical protein